MTSSTVATSNVHARDRDVTTRPPRTTVGSGRPDELRRVTFSARTLLERFQMMAFLNKGLTIRFHDRRESDDAESVVYFYEGGIRDFVRHVNAAKEALFNAVGYFQDADNGQEVEIAFQWNTGYQSDGIHSFANGINTVEGGMHEEGFRTALTLAINNYIFDKGKLGKDDRLLGEDIAKVSRPSQCAAARPSFGSDHGNLATCPCHARATGAY